MKKRIKIDYKRFILNLFYMIFEQEGDRILRIFVEENL